MARHLLPNIVPTIIVLASLGFGGVILSESSLSFLGYGIPPPTPTWGGMLANEGRSYMFSAPWMLIAPTTALGIVVFANALSLRHNTRWDLTEDLAYIRVPMLLIHPGRFGLPARISQLGSVQDILPTTFDLLGLPLEPRDGMSLFFDAPERLVFALTDYGPGQIGLRDKRFTYILFRNGKELFFDRDADPAELTNVLDRFPEDVARFRARLQPKK